MYVIVQHGSRQYKVSEGDALLLDRLDERVEQPLEMDRVLFYSDGKDCRVGRPTIPGAKVVVAPTRPVLGRKITVTKMRRRKGYRLKRGHRQKYTEVRVKEIVIPEASGA